MVQNTFFKLWFEHEIHYSFVSKKQCQRSLGIVQWSSIVLRSPWMCCGSELMTETSSGMQYISKMLQVQPQWRKAWELVIRNNLWRWWLNKNLPETCEEQRREHMFSTRWCESAGCTEDSWNGNRWAKCFCKVQPYVSLWGRCRMQNELLRKALTVIDQRRKTHPALHEQIGDCGPWLSPEICRD